MSEWGETVQQRAADILKEEFRKLRVQWFVDDAENDGPCDMTPWMILVEAVMKGMREPTDAMAEAGFQHTGDPCWPEDVKKAWRAMIDEALR